MNTVTACIWSCLGKKLAFNVFIYFAILEYVKLFVHVPKGIQNYSENEVTICMKFIKVCD